ncbi:hypothetical protein [Nocardioides endophyticus]
MILPAAVALLFTAFYVVLCGLALSGEQTAVRDLGAADAQLSIGVSPGDRAAEPNVEDRLRRDVEGLGASESWVVLRSFDVRPDAIPRPMTTGKSRIVSYVEASDIETLFPSGRKLGKGRWPSAPGEVAITEGLRDRLEAKDALVDQEFTAFSGAATFTVTGTFTDTFAESSYGVIAAPGTWNSMPTDEIAQRFTGTGAQLSLYWKGPASADGVAHALARISGGSEKPDEIITGLVDRATWESVDDLSLADTAGFVFTLPFLTLSVAAVAMAGRSVLGWARGVVEAMVRVGLRRRRLVILVTGMTAGLAALAFGAGVLAGLLVGEGLRAVVLPSIVDQPVGPVRDLRPLALVAVLVPALIVPVIFSPLLAHASGPSRLRLVARSVPWSLLRWLAVAVLLIRSLASAGTRDSDSDSAGILIAQLVAATILLVPDIMRLLVATLSTSKARTLIAKRLMQADRARFAIIGTLVAVSIAAPVSASTFVATSTRTEAAANLSAVPDGQLWVDRSEGRPAARASHMVADDVGAQPIELGATMAFSEGNTESVGAIQAGIRTVRSMDDLGDLLGTRIASEYESLLTSGGVLLISGVSEGRTVLIQPGKADPQALPGEFAVVRGVAPELQQAAAGFMLTSTAQDLGLRVTPSLDVFNDLSDQQIRSATAAVERAGRDTHPLQYHVVPEPTSPTRDWYTALVGLLSVTTLILGALVIAQANYLRGYGARLVALGLRHRWTLAVGFNQLGLTLLGAGLAATGASVSAIAILAGATRQRLILDIPWDFIAVVVVSTLGVCAAVFVVVLWPARRHQRPRSSTA